MSDDPTHTPSERPPAEPAQAAPTESASDGAKAPIPSNPPPGSIPPPSGGSKRKATLQPSTSSVPPPPLAMDDQGDPAATPLVVPHDKTAHDKTGSVPPAAAVPADADLDAITADYDLDDAPTQDYDPRARGVFERPTLTEAEEPGPPPPIPPSVPPSVPPADPELPVAAIPTPPPPADAVLAAADLAPEPSAEKEGDASTAVTPPTSSRRRGKRRSSRRTVKIPDDPVVHAKPKAAKPPEEPAAKAEPAENPSPPEPAPPVSDTAPAEAEVAAELTDLADDVDSEAVTIIRPMQIVEVQGTSKPPPDVIAAKAPPAPSGPPPPTGRQVSAPPPPTRPKGEAAAVSTPPAKPPPPVSGKSPKPPPVEEPEEEEVDDEIIISTTPLTQADLDSIEEIEPDRMSLTPPEPQPAARKPPPPPPSKERAAKQRNREKEPAAPPAAQKAERQPTPTQPPAAERKRQKPWWEELFGDDYLRTMDRLNATHIKREVDFVEDSLGVEKGAVILDLACGSGQHAVELASRGYNVVGYDLSLAMLARAADEAQERQQKLNFLQGDMREMAFEEMFDGVYCWSTSFGYFDDERNLSVLQRIHRALRQGGMLLLDVINRDYVAPRSPSLVWFEGDGCVCMDDMHVDFFTSRLRVKRTVMFDDGRSRELDYSIRLYALHELGKMLHDSGFKVVEVTGHPAHLGVFFGSESPRMMVLAERG